MRGSRAEPGWDGVDPDLIFSPTEGVVPGWEQGLHGCDSVLPSGRGLTAAHRPGSSSK